jgi:phage terminase large subunit-like protein
VQSRDQAAIIFGAASRMIRLNPALTRAVTIQETAKSLLCPELGTRYRALSADATTAHGLSPQLVIHDELGLVRGPRIQFIRSARACDRGAGESALDHHLDTGAD